MQRWFVCISNFITQNIKRAPLKGWNLIKLVMLMLLQGPSLVKLTFFFPFFYGKCTWVWVQWLLVHFCAIALNHANAPAVLPISAFSVSEHVSTQWKRQITSLYYYENSLTLQTPWKGREYLQEFTDYPLRTTVKWHW